jgi:two-component system sensor histidine kinase HydH
MKSIGASSAGIDLSPWQNIVAGDMLRASQRGEGQWRSILLVVGIAALAAAHWFAPHAKSIHNVLFHLDIIPILVAGMILGRKAVLWVTALIAVTELPQVLFQWPNDLVYVMDQVGELTVFGAAGFLVGYLADRQRRQRKELEKTTLELERVYVELQRNIERLTKAERLSAVAQLSASLAHEIRNPLAGISGAAGILRRGHASQENVRECVEIIEKESQRLNKLLTHFLEFARPRTPRMQPTDLAELIDSVVALAAHSPGASAIEFRRVVAENLPEVECDSEQLKQVLLNLVINSIEAVREGVIELHARAEESSAVITVRDRGAGLPPDRQGQMFEPFFTTKDNGTGLGLAIAAKIVEQHGGSLSASSEPGRGTDMVVQLPLRQAVNA